MTEQLTDPTNLPAGDRRPILVNLPAPAPELFVTPEGRQWRCAGTKADGLRYFVPAHLDPAKVNPVVWASEAFLKSELGDITPAVAA